MDGTIGCGGIIWKSIESCVHVCEVMEFVGENIVV